MADEVLVIGAGVIGLTTAIRAAEAGRSVRVLAADPPRETTSAVAGAMVGPLLAPPGAQSRVWGQATIDELTARADIPGVRVARGLLAAGGELRTGRVASLADAAGSAPRVANCSGLGARELVPDPDVQPVRGPKVVVENPGLDTFFVEAPFGPAWTAYLPHGDHVVLGGRAVAGDESLQPDPAEAAEILQACAEVEPRLAGARILEHRVGLRPGRPEVRLEAERVDDALVVHNYGHGGEGVMLSWGCAADAVALLTASPGRRRPRTAAP